MSDTEPETPAKPPSVAMRHTASGRTMRASRAAFERQYSQQGWVIVDTAPAAADPSAEQEEAGDAGGGAEGGDGDDAGVDKPPAKAPAKGRGKARAE